MSPEVFPFRALSLEASGIVTLAKMDGIGIVTKSDNSGRVHSKRLSRIQKKACTEYLRRCCSVLAPDAAMNHEPPGDNESDIMNPSELL